MPLLDVASSRPPRLVCGRLGRDVRTHGETPLHRLVVRTGGLDTPLRVAVTTVLLAVLACVPFLLHWTPEFRCDDFILVAQGWRTGILEGFLHHMGSPFWNTRIIQFYRPLFTWHFCIDAQLFGNHAAPYFAVNVAIQGASVAMGFLVSRNFLRTPFALAASLLFLANPWAANNVAWFAGRSTSVCTLLSLVTIWLYIREVRRARPFRAVLYAIVPFTLAVFYRETGIFALLFVALADIFEGRRGRRDLLRWSAFLIPVLAYLVTKRLILGVWIGGYAPFHELDAQGTSTEWSRIGVAYLRILVPGSGAEFSFDASRPRIAALAAGGLLLALGLAGLFRHRNPAWIFFGFAGVYALPILVMDPVVHGSNGQRWHTVMWAVAAGWAALAEHSLDRRTGIALLAALALHSGWRLHENLQDYEHASRLSVDLRRQIQAAPAGDVFVYNLRETLGAALFYPLATGQTDLPPFGSGDHAVYPILYEQRFGPHPLQQTPIAFWAYADGRRFTALWLDDQAERVRRMLAPQLELGARSVALIPHRSLMSPGEKDERADLLRVDATGMDRLVIHLLVPMRELALPRRRTGRYKFGRFSTEAGRVIYEENLSEALEWARFMDGAAEGRCFLWVVGYGPKNPRQPKFVSDFHLIRAR